MRASMNAQNRPGLDRVDRLRLRNPGGAAIDVAHQKRARVAMHFAKVIFGFEERRRQRSMRVRVDDRAVRSRGIIRAL